MICLDTNVLARSLMGDDPRQSPQADAFIRTLTEANPGWISLTSIQELVWIMDRRIKMERADILVVLESLASRSVFVIEKAGEFSRALQLYRKTRADFADCLIAVLARQAGCTKIVTFDKVAARELGMERIA